DGVAIDEQRSPIVVEGHQADREPDELPRQDLLGAVGRFAIEDGVRESIAPTVVCNRQQEPLRRPRVVGEPTAIEILLVAEGIVARILLAWIGLIEVRPLVDQHRLEHDDADLWHGHVALEQVTERGAETPHRELAGADIGRSVEQCGGGIDRQRTEQDAPQLRDDHVFAAGGYAEACADVEKVLVALGLEPHLETEDHARRDHLATQRQAPGSTVLLGGERGGAERAARKEVQPPVPIAHARFRRRAEPHHPFAGQRISDRCDAHRFSSGRRRTSVAIWAGASGAPLLAIAITRLATPLRAALSADRPTRSNSGATAAATSACTTVGWLIAALICPKLARPSPNCGSLNRSVVLSAAA